MNDFQTAIKKQFTSRWWLILLLAIFIGGGLMAEKAMFGETVTKSSLYYVEQSVFIRYPAGEQGVSASNTSSSDKYFASFAMMSDFLKTAESRYDFSKLDAGWPSMGLPQRLLWMQKHFMVYNEGGVVVFAIYLPADVNKDPAYLGEHGKAILEDYIATTKTALEAGGLHPTYEKGSELEAVPEHMQVSNKRVIAKYGAVGALLGALLGVFLLLVSAMRQSRHA